VSRPGSHLARQEVRSWQRLAAAAALCLALAGCTTGQQMAVLCGVSQGLSDRIVQTDWNNGHQFQALDEWSSSHDYNDSCMEAANTIDQLNADNAAVAAEKAAASPPWTPPWADTTPGKPLPSPTAALPASLQATINSLKGPAS
jgi:hypothetical protein